MQVLFLLNYFDNLLLVLPIESGLRVNTSVEGESLINEVERMVNNKESIKNTKSLIYTNRSEGVLTAFNIRSDRFDIAIDATDKIRKSYQARKDGVIQMNNDKEVGDQSISGT